ncbi:PBSX family phage terminase large subunit [Neobittarella massiliensis]|uniref:PBSX family phage terminase large subunit n=1 Tax=Neobittarella massiliensis (ex Bilen et al. 2018) TaxID=2041842 RepID=A0A8J6IRN1_9FIRM|nr:phage terminase large subunit [Neobittarella massiliensis]MBC3517208.1 PBSX family phage terminase large subunit [Neobittarella massiliensis]
MALSNKQIEYLQSCGHRWNIKVGATGSGKSWLDYAIVVPKRLMALRGQGAAVLLGNTQGTLSRNILDPMRDIWGDKLVGAISSDNTARLFGHRVHILGADNRKHVARIQGMTIEYAYGDEMTTWHEDVFQMLKSRLRCAHSYFDGTANPADPHHFVKTFIDSDADTYCQTSTIDDNPFLPVEFVENLKKEYAGTVYYNRFILGQWAAAEGIIYRGFADSIAAGSNQFIWPNNKPIWRVHIGIDFGGTGSAHSFVATGVLPGYQGAVGLMSQRIPAQGTTPDDLYQSFLCFAEAVFTSLGKIDAVYCDSAEQVLIRGLQSYLRTTRYAWLAGRIHNAAKISITDRIHLTAILMGGGRFWYTDQAEGLRDALASALWKSKGSGKDERLDDGTTDIDTLDAFEYTIERDYKRYLRLS